MTTTTPSNDNEAKTLHEFRVNTVCVRLKRAPTPDDPDNIEVAFAGTPKGLDSPHAVRPEHLWDLRNAMKAASIMLELADSATISEERAANREFIRLGVIDLHDDPATAYTSETAWSEKATAAPETDQAEPVSFEDKPFSYSFRVDGLYGRVYGRSRRMTPDEMGMEFAEHEALLDSPRAMSVWSHVAIYKAMMAASVLKDIASCPCSDREAAIGFKRLCSLGVKLVEER